VTLGAALLGFVPLSLLSGWLDWGLPGVWTGLTLFIVLRLVAVGQRVRGSAWLGETVTR
jgi:Na+-driven multidrug efflux pump